VIDALLDTGVVPVAPHHVVAVPAQLAGVPRVTMWPVSSGARETHEMAASIEKRVHLTADRVERLLRLAQTHQLSEDQIIERALDVLFSLTDVLDTPTERRGWSLLSEESLRRVWDNEDDARYDNWRELYGASAR
jgi:hypothetical protein